ncbi:MAG TPA: Asp-tRNA(Asn)/Glu-tRNA(Gln) amidotransferase subunit GatC [Candidatus Paceibacterota bacterium]|nr:Asp-tRNA(Asn)/Glu-tRNA(Gln) amidotransferase subunit GatC [Candidatus Paceibacterota bacterium]
MTDPKVDIKALATLARLEISDAEVAKLEEEIPAILRFVEQIQSVATDVKPKSPELHNVMRADENPHESGLYTKKLLDAAPKADKDRVVVKQVLSRKQK